MKYFTKFFVASTFIFLFSYTQGFAYGIPTFHTATIAGNNVTINAPCPFSGYGSLFATVNEKTLFYLSPDFNCYQLPYNINPTLYGIPVNIGDIIQVGGDGQYSDLFVYTGSGLTSYIDTTSPNITILGENPLKLIVSTSTSYIDPGATSTDNIDGDITLKIATSSNVDTTKPGTYLVTYTATDNAGNIATTSRTVIVSSSRNPVIIIPGIASSYLNDISNKEIWPNVTRALANILGDTYLDDLVMNESGQPDISVSTIVPGDIIRKVVNKDLFDSLINKLKNDGYVEEQDLFVFPYDWRLDVRDDVSPLKNKIDQILQQTNSNKINIIAHSMGGLLAKEYIKDYSQGRVDKFIDIATPHFGAPSSFTTLMYGDDMGVKFGLLGLNSEEIKKISQNMPSVYQLLPSAAYFSAVLPDYQYYLDDMDDFDQDGIKGKLSYEQSNQFLKNTGRNSYILDHSVDIHNDLDSMNPDDYGVQTYNIIGCGTPTIGKIYRLGNEKNKDNQYGISYITGDGTVPRRSAEGMNSNAQYYETVGAEHATLPSKDDIKNLVSSLLSETGFDFPSYQNIATTSDKCSPVNGTVVMFHSPVDVHIYDRFGNHTGPTAAGDIEYTVPDITYDIIDSNKFVFLPNDDYQIKLDATDIGSFNSHIQKIVNGEVISTEYFSDIPLVSTSTKVEVKITNATSTIILDSIGDGSQKENIYASSQLIGNSEDRFPPVTEINVISPLTTSGNGQIIKDAQVVFQATDTESGILKTEYSVDGGQTWQQYADSIKTSTNTIEYFSIDKAGNIENINYYQIPSEIQHHARRSLNNVSASSSSVVQISEIIGPTVVTISTSSVSMISSSTEVRQEISLESDLKKIDKPIKKKNIVLIKKPEQHKLISKSIKLQNENNIATVALVQDNGFFSKIRSLFERTIFFVKRLIKG